MLSDYDVEQGTMNIHCDNSNANINFPKIPFFILELNTEIHHHFIRDLIEDKVISLEFVPTVHQLTDIFTKPLDSLSFEFLRKSFGICLID